MIDSYVPSGSQCSRLNSELLVSDGFCMHCPVVDVSQPTYIIKRVAFETGCKRDICEPDLICDGRFIGIK
jgi:hypothetical protein